jgi:hypothetical protein
VLESSWWALYLLSREADRESSQRRIDLEKGTYSLLCNINVKKNEDLRPSPIHTICSC